MKLVSATPHKDINTAVHGVQYTDRVTRLSNVAAQEQLRLRRSRIFCDRKDVLNELYDAELIKRYRLDHEGILFVTNLVRETLARPITRNKALTPHMKVIITLRFLATGKLQLYNSDDLCPSQQTVNRVITETLDALSSRPILAQFIKFPITPHETQRKKMEFVQIAGFLGVIGV
ncbi:hypothetical protein Pcinc_001470 [Petrolisthes cinctipes]|uniref:Uncharacterized protein n=1 Tax=Petrolisthes cinctipes TaxID=88211 RepID=A0AAE1GMU9_PETCI|nr:hypothetical protein Pcinc_001470 [Petrolisthes cinctipes]